MYIHITLNCQINTAPKPKPLQLEKSHILNILLSRQPEKTPNSSFHSIFAKPSARVTHPRGLRYYLLLASRIHIRIYLVEACNSRYSRAGAHYDLTFYCYSQLRNGGFCKSARRCRRNRSRGEGEESVRDR